jgi:hypothetical protein
VVTLGTHVVIWKSFRTSVSSTVFGSSNTSSLWSVTPLASNLVLCLSVVLFRQIFQIWTIYLDSNLNTLLAFFFSFFPGNCLTLGTVAKGKGALSWSH